MCMAHVRRVTCAVAWFSQDFRFIGSIHLSFINSLFTKVLNFLVLETKEAAMATKDTAWVQQQLNERVEVAWKMW